MKTFAIGFVTVLALAGAARAQDTNAPTEQNTSAPTELKRVVVTGSLIPTAETVGPAPVETISAAEIEKVGAQDVLQLVKRLSPAFQGNGNTGQEVNNGGFGESYVSIRNLPTLVLLNGRRLGNSSFSNGGLVDLNTIPLAAIERVEVLKDGASALYGSEAEGGVVNIITKKEFSDVEFGGRYGAATGQGKFTEQRVSAVMGSTTEHSSLMVAAQYYHRDALQTSDRNIASMSADELAANNVDPYGVSYMSPSFPGKVQDSTGAYILKSSPLLAPFGLYDPNAPKSPPRIPNGSGGYKVFSGPTAVSDYRNDPSWGSPANSPYVPDPGVILNTTTLGTDTIQSQDRKNVFVSGTHELFGKQMELFSDFLYANIDSEGRLAPSPVVGLGAMQDNINIPANNIYNPFGIALGPDAGSGGLPPGGPRVRSRFWDSGNRLFDSQTDYYHLVGGLKGEFDNGWGYNAAYNYNCYDQIEYTRNAINGAALGLALQPSANSNNAALGLSKLAGANGQPVPMYNLFSIPGQNSAATLDAIRTTLFQSGKSQEWDAIGTINGTPLDLPGGKLGVAGGGGFTSESLMVDYDGLTRIGEVPGLNAAQPTSGRRDSWAAFAETRIPITSPDLNLPLLRSLEFTVAGRYETFDPGGDKLVPKLGLRWQPFDEQVTIRASMAKSFVAPTTYELFGGNAASVPALYVPTTPGAGASYSGLQENENLTSNAGLKPATARSWGAGIVFTPKAVKGLTVSLDYYHIKTRNDIFRVPDQSMVDDINAKGVNSVWAPYFTKADGSKITTADPNQANDAEWGVLNDPLQNGASIETDGLDLSGVYQFEPENAGRFTLFANANILLHYDYSDPVAGLFHYAGMYSDPNAGDPGGQGTLPDWQLNMGLTWDFRNFTYSVDARYIPSTRAASGQYYTINGDGWRVNDWYSIDMQLAYEFKSPGKWYHQTRFTVGCDNVTDNDPPLIAGAFEDNTDKSAYDIIGRFVYVEISKKF